jgi:NAD+ diphosphatase
MPSPIDLGPRPHLAYANSPLDRAAERRTDDAALSALRQAQTSLHYVVGGDWVVLKKTTSGGFDPAFSFAEVSALANDAWTLFLGLQDNVPRFGFGLEPQFAETLKTRDDFFVTDLRSIAVQGLVPADHLPALAETKSLIHWHLRHRFCSNCGAHTQITQAGWRRDCPQCKAQHFPRTDPVAIMLAFDGDRCLMGRQTRFVPNTYSCLAGFVEPGESLEEAVRRETLEEAGIRCGRVRYFASQPWPFPSSLMIGCHAQAISHDITIDRTELEDARWFSRDETAAMLVRQHPQGLITPPPSAIAHHIIRAWVEDGDAVLG